MLRFPDGSTKIVDTTVTHPHKSFHSVSIPGYAADQAKLRKLAKYDARWSFPAGTSLTIAAFETGGRWHPDTITLVNSYILSMFRDDPDGYTRALWAAKQRLSVALRKSVATTIIAFGRRALAFPVVQLP